MGLKTNPLAVISTDWHLKKENIDQIIDLVNQQCSLAVELGSKHIICLGDVFESRIAQRQDVLTAFSDIIDIVESHKLELNIIPGNHDKTVYSGFESFLDPFKGRVNLVKMLGGIPYKEHKLVIQFIPFFRDDVWMKQFEELQEYNSEIYDDWKKILCTHIAVTGSKNNDGTYVSSGITPSLFKDYFKVLSGHYHDQQKIGDNFYHLPSIQQNNFGEDNQKGFTVLYSDGSHKLFKSKFKEYIKIEVDVDATSKEEIDVLKNKYRSSEDNIRFDLKGSENVLKSFKKEEFTSLGIDVRTKVKEIEDDIVFSETEEVKEHTASSIREEFKNFCEKQNYNLEVGLKYLNKKLK